ncbi:MAG: transposase family protein [Planctomycetaceae bacterium]
MGAACSAGPVGRVRRHPRAAMLTAVASALLCGNRGYAAIVEWLHELPVDVWHWMGYTRKPPKQDCFRDLLMKLDPAALEGVLSQCRVDQKTNEHKAALDLLKSMVLEGQVIVGDAMFCQRDLCAQIVDAGGDYFFPVKENQPTLLREIQLELAANEAAPASRYTGPLRTTPA